MEGLKLFGQCPYMETTHFKKGLPLSLQPNLFTRIWTQSACFLHLSPTWNQIWAAPSWRWPTSGYFRKICKIPLISAPITSTPSHFSPSNMHPTLFSLLFDVTLFVSPLSNVTLFFSLFSNVSSSLNSTGNDTSAEEEEEPVG